MTGTGTHSAWRAAGLGLAGCLALHCATLRPASPGAVADGAFVPAQPPALTYGADAQASCHAARLIQLLGNEAPTATVDGQLCLAAEALLGWPDNGEPPPPALDFLAWHLGLPSPPRLRVATQVFETEEMSELATAVGRVLQPFAAKARTPRYGVAQLRLSKGSTRVVLVMQVPTVELSQVPRRLELGASVTARGRLLTAPTNGTLLVSDAQGNLERTPLGANAAFEAQLTCGQHAGRIQVEVRGEENGAERALVGFPVQCGLPLATRGPLPSAPAAAGADVALKVLEQLNAEREAAGLRRLDWDEAVATVARSNAETLRELASHGAAAAPDPRPGLLQAQAMSALVLENSAQAVSGEEAQRQFSLSPTWRANFMNSEATHAGVGVVPGEPVNGQPTVYVIELLVRRQAPVDLAVTQRTLQKKIAEQRDASHAAPLTFDPALDAAAARYAALLAGSQGALADAQGNELLAPLRKSYRTIDVLSGVKADPLTFAGDVTGKGPLAGVGLAQGTHPTFGKNSVYVVVLLGAHR